MLIAADGIEVKMDMGGAAVEFMGDITWATVIFEPDNAEPILGVTALGPWALRWTRKTNDLNACLPSV